MTKPNNDARTPTAGAEQPEYGRESLEHGAQLPLEPSLAAVEPAPHPARAREADGWFDAAETNATTGAAQANAATPPRAQLDGSAPKGVGPRTSPHHNSGPDNDPRDGDVSMSSELGLDLLEGEFVTEATTKDAAATRRGQPRERFVVVDGPNKQTSLLDTLRGRLQEGVSELQERGEQLAFAGKLKLEQRSLESDREALFTRLGRAYFRRAEPDVLAVIEHELHRVERDIRINEAQQEAHEQHVQQAKAERERPQVRLPTPEADVGTAFDLRAQPPRIEHNIDAKERDTFFGLDKGGVDQAATVQGGNAAFDTTPANADDHVLTIDELPDEDKG